MVLPKISIRLLLGLAIAVLLVYRIYPVVNFPLHAKEMQKHRTVGQDRCITSKLEEFLELVAGLGKRMNE